MRMLGSVELLLGKSKDRDLMTNREGQAPTVSTKASFHSTSETEFVDDQASAGAAFITSAVSVGLALASGAVGTGTGLAGKLEYSFCRGGPGSRAPFQLAHGWELTMCTAAHATPQASAGAAFITSAVSVGLALASGAVGTGTGLAGKLEYSFCRGGPGSRAPFQLAHGWELTMCTAAHATPQASAGAAFITSAVAVGLALSSGAFGTDTGLGAAGNLAYSFCRGAAWPSLLMLEAQNSNNF
ncbi:hypothetical protein AK812_SmicGene29131 [Symbiodinium microadriaticum]|uniref:Uncharacterized protein n=1 Tax=Symbiodinium microadriaticum TaxID=2951 RepID=A0A1Q9D2M9_SYMMI|nr:hypothetical protein AK812_SmicGene29131 [Symbiodinium microadriaticum]